MPATGRLIATAGAPTKCGKPYGGIDTGPMADLKVAKPAGKPRLLALPSGPLTTKFGGEPPKLRHKTSGTERSGEKVTGSAGLPALGITTDGPGWFIFSSGATASVMTVLKVPVQNWGYLWQ